MHTYVSMCVHTYIHTHIHTYIQGCELIIALTHMRSLNDKRLAESVPDIDLVLGGHDHHYERSEINGILVLKSGSDFRDFSEVTVTFRKDDKPQVSVERHTITRAIEEVS